MVSGLEYDPEKRVRELGLFGQAKTRLGCSSTSLQIFEGNYKEPLPSVAGGITRGTRGNGHGLHLGRFRPDKRKTCWKVQRMIQTWTDSPWRFSRLGQTKARLP